MLTTCCAAILSHCVCYKALYSSWLLLLTSHHLRGFLIPLLTATQYPFHVLPPHHHTSCVTCVSKTTMPSTLPLLAAKSLLAQVSWFENAARPLTAPKHCQANAQFKNPQTQQLTTPRAFACGHQTSYSPGGVLLIAV